MRKTKLALAVAGMASTMFAGVNLMAADAAVAKATATTAADSKKAEVKADKWAFLPEVVAEMDGKKITREQISAMIDKMLADSPYASMMNESMLKRMVPGFVNNYVETQVMLKLAEADGIKASPELAQKYLNDMIAMAPADQIEEFKKSLAGKGQTFDQYKKETAANPMFQDQAAISIWVKDKLEPTIKVTPEQEKEFYEKNKTTLFYIPEMIEASHILIAPEKKDDEAKKAAKEKTEKILADIKSGKVKFEDAAEKESICPSGKKSKGNLGKFKADMMVPAFSNAAFALEKPSQISEVVETSFGYHIIRLEEKFPAKQLQESDPEVKAEIDKALKGKQLQEIMLKKLEEAKKQYKVKVFVEAPAMPDMPVAPAQK